eukprot:364843-Chlamydomonas_euryale.AAC.3
MPRGRECLGPALGLADVIGLDLRPRHMFCARTTPPRTAAIKLHRLQRCACEHPCGRMLVRFKASRTLGAPGGGPGTAAH